MPSGSVSDYAAVHAAARSKYAGMLRPQLLSELFAAPNFDTVVALLKNTVYGPSLSSVDEKDLTPRRAVYQLWSQMADTYTLIIRLAPSFSRPLLTQLYRHFEVDNLKAVLRSILSGASWEQALFVLFPLGETGVLPAEAMLETRSIPAAVELLHDTPYYPTLSHAMDRYTSEKSLFPLEVALDLDYWRTLWNDVNHLPSRDREQAVRIIGTLLDKNNLMWAIRYREYHRLSEEEIINYTLPFGYHVSDEDIRAIAAGTDIPQILRRIFPDLPQPERLLQDPAYGLPQLEVNLQKHVAYHCRAAFAGYPFHIGIPLAYLVLKELEIQDLTVLIEAKSTQMPSERFQPYLLMAEAPG
jgi:V/A-type H+-transporting ATPase subunit C